MGLERYFKAASEGLVPWTEVLWGSDPGNWKGLNQWPGSTARTFCNEKRH